MTISQPAPVTLPRVAITFCTQCRWMLRAAYFAQELLSTFGNTIGEVALIPATGGLFTVELTYVPHTPAPEDVAKASPSNVEATKVLLWDRKAEGGFPETKVLKQRVRDHLDPGRDLGHSDKHGGKKTEEMQAQDLVLKSTEQGQEADALNNGVAKVKLNADGTVCEECK